MKYKFIKNFLQSHLTVIFAVAALACLVSFYFWATDDVIAQLSRALISPSSQKSQGFDLAAVQRLNLHGLVGGASSTSATTTISPTSSVIVATTTAK